MKLIHIHGFKCAGSTLELILNREYPNLLKVESSKSGKRLFFDDIPSKLLDTDAISSHLLSPTKGIEALQVSLLRNPLERIVSAWKFETKGKKKLKESSLSLREYVENYKKSILSNYQSKLLSFQKKSDHFSCGWEIAFDLEYLFSQNFFIGTVERFDESMVLIEQRLKKKGIQIDMSYPSRQNTTQSIKSKYNQANLERFLYPASDVDTWLLNLTNRKIDQEINSIHNFEILLNDYKLRCKTSIFVKHYSEVNYI
jgi:hypothetical protein